MTAEDGIELGEKLRNHTAETRVKLDVDSEDDELCATRMGAIEDSLYSAWKMNGSLGKFEKEGLYRRNMMAVEVQEKFMGYLVLCEKDGKRSYADRAVMHLARSEAWTACSVDDEY